MKINKELLNQIVQTSIIKGQITAMDKYNPTKIPETIKMYDVLCKPTIIDYRDSVDQVNNLMKFFENFEYKLRDNQQNKKYFQ